MSTHQHRNAKSTTAPVPRGRGCDKELVYLYMWLCRMLRELGRPTNRKPRVVLASPALVNLRARSVLVLTHAHSMSSHHFQRNPVAQLVPFQPHTLPGLNA